MATKPPTSGFSFKITMLEFPAMGPLFALKQTHGFWASGLKKPAQQNRS